MRRLQHSWGGFLASGEWLSLAFVLALTLAPVFALIQADWPIDAGVAVATTVIGVLTGFWLARSAYSEAFALLLAALLSLFVVFSLSAASQPGNLVAGLRAVLERLAIWVFDAFTGGINQDELVFTLLLALLFWMVAFNAAWHVFRSAAVWRAILPPATILFANAVLYTGAQSLDASIALFVLVALLLVARESLDMRQWHWYVSGVRVPRNLRHSFFGVGAGLALLGLMLAWSVPTANLSERLQSFQEFMRSDPLRELSEVWNRLVTPIESEGPVTSDYYGGDQLNLSGAISLSEEVVMSVAAPDDGTRYYWQSRVFERYERGQWSPSATLRVPDFEAPMTIQTSDEMLGGQRRSVDQEFTIAGYPSRLLYAAPQPLRFSEVGRLDLRYINDDPAQMNVSVVRPRSVIQPGSSYSATSALSTASAQALRAAGTTYPEWVTMPNTYLDSSVSPRVIALADDIVTIAGATNPYDKAKAIEVWLRTNIAYDDRIPPPPAGVDPVEWFLFEQRSGYCTYYATAMAIMLRSQGIPARLAAGFSQGDWDAGRQRFVVQEQDAHTWVEAFFPGYGWIVFEPTAAEAPLEREGDEETAPLPQGETPPPPTMTPTMPPTPTPLPSPTPTPPLPQQQAGAELPTMTPTSTPSPTPVIVPTALPPAIEPSATFLDRLLPVLLLLLVLIAALTSALLLLAFLWWWWEWRGMRSLSPIARAYARLLRYAGLIGIRVEDWQTPEEKRLRIVRVLPASERPVSFITRVYAAERYARPVDRARSSAREDHVNNAWEETRGEFLRRWARSLLPWNWGRRDRPT
jgi:transglutaminase-like putative cysteine protease